MQMVKEVDFFLPDHLEKRLFCTPMKQQVLRLVLFVDTRLFFRIHKATAYPRHPPGMVFDVDTGGRTVLQQNGGITFRMGDADMQRRAGQVRRTVRTIGYAGRAARKLLQKHTAGKPFPVVDDAVGETMRAEIAAAKAEGDSVGGIVECAVLGLPVGLGGPLFDGMEGRISSIVFGIPAVKGIEFGIGFGAARLRGSETAQLRGSENNDPFVVENGTVRTTTNHCGGILGGITNGMPLTFRAAFKPTPSIAKEQQSVNLNTLTPEILRVRGRHDPCIVPRAVPCIEAAAAIAVYDALLGQS